MKNCSYHDNTDYLSSSQFRSYLKRGRIIRDQEETDSLELGSLAHLCFLETEIFNSTVRAMDPMDRRTKAGKEAFEAYQELKIANPELTFVSEQDYKTVREMTRVLSQDENISKFKIGSKIEAEYYGQISDVKCKCKPDILNINNGILIDYKTTTDASDSFVYSIKKYRYDIQMAFYSMVLKFHNINIDRYIIIAQEKIPPYDYQIFELSQDVIFEAKTAVKEGLEQYKLDLILGFNGYNKSIKLVDKI